MDPFTAACGAAQIIGLTGQAIEGVRWIRRKFKEIKAAPRIIKNLYRELQVFENTLIQLSSIDQSSISDEAAASFTTSIMECADIFGTLAKVLMNTDFEYNENGAKKLYKQMVANEKRKDFEEHIQRLDRAKASLIATMAGMQLDITKYGISPQRMRPSMNEADWRCSDFRKESTAHAQIVEQSLCRVESGISSIQAVSEVIRDTTFETRNKIETVASIMTKVEHSIQNLRTDLPALLEPAIDRCLEKRLEGEFKHIGVAGSLSVKQLSDRNQYQDRPTRGQWDLDVSKSSKPPVEVTWGNPPPMAAIGNFQFPQSTRAPTRKKTYVKTFSLPFGFIQSKTVQRTYNASSNNGEVTEKEVLRVEITVVPFSWLSSRGQVVSIEKVYDQHSRPLWTYTPRTYNILPEDAMVVSACKKQDLDTVKRLFEYRQASPFDVDTKGYSLLALALGEYPQLLTIEPSLQLIKFLISEGADPTTFISFFLWCYEQYTGDFWILDNLDIVGDEDIKMVKLFDEIWRLCLQSCQADPFVDIHVLEQLWNSSIGGRCAPPLDPAYLFQDRFTGFDDLLFENPDKVFSDLMGHRNCLGSGSIDTWKRITDQIYETLVYVCYGGSESYKAKIFSPSYSATVPWRHDSCFCPTTPSHLLFKIFHGSDKGRPSWRAHLKYHLHRMVVLLLQNGEDPEATCACKTSWQPSGGHRSVTDYA
jgi:hypothetical protein